MDEERPVDVLIVGAGISGISMAAHLKMMCPELTFAMFERRDSIGGTWDLFRYPGVRSDSDIYTLGFPFRPWRGDRAIVEGMLRMAEALHLDVVAEGIETEAQRDLLRVFGCRYGQGFLYARPSPVLPQPYLGLDMPSPRVGTDERVEQG